MKANEWDQRFAELELGVTDLERRIEALTSDDTAAITRLLAEHDIVKIGYDPYTSVCRCGVETIADGPRKRGYTPEHRAHVAAVLAAHMADREAAAWREGCLAVCNGGIDECGMSEREKECFIAGFRAARQAGKEEQP